VRDDLVTPRKKRDGLPGSELEADEWMPGVMRGGIVYPDKIMAVNGVELARKANPTEKTGRKELAEAFLVHDLKELKIAMREKLASPGKKKVGSPVRHSPARKKTPTKFWQQFR
jgi:hypothetical protein